MVSNKKSFLVNAVPTPYGYICQYSDNQIWNIIMQFFSKNQQYKTENKL